MSLKIATWNVNSLKARLEHVVRWLGDMQPDVLMMQELKGMEFPAEALAQAGYPHQVVKGQKSYNGVAIICRRTLNFVADALPGDEADDQARYTEADLEGVRLINIYLPNGNPVGTEKFAYKLAWMKRLYTRLADLRRQEIPFLIGGDFNVIPEDGDCHDPAAWIGDALFQPESRRLFRSYLHLGLTDAFRAFHKEPGHYTFWDYQAGAWPRNLGIRIDHILTSPALSDRLAGCVIDKTPRGWDKASDHTPVIVEIES